ncbi:MAG: hypothetical protein NVSMB42_06000 [Herpetosiphon sp.]
MMTRWTTLLLLTLLGLALPTTGHAQDPITRVFLARTTLPTVVAEPLFFKLLKVELPAGSSMTLQSGDSLLYQAVGSQTLAVGGKTSTLHSGMATTLARGTSHTHTATAGGPSMFLLYQLLPARDLDTVIPSGAATITEVARGSEPIPALHAGAYKFDLQLVTFAPHLAPNPPHYRTGGAMYYVLGGTGTFIAHAQAPLTKHTGDTNFEYYGLVHQWGNPGDVPLALLIGAVTPAALPPVLPGTPATSGPITPRLPQTGGTTLPLAALALLGLAFAVVGTISVGSASWRRS